MHFQYLIFSFLVVLFQIASSEDVEDLNTVVELKSQGKLEGLHLSSRKGRKYAGFLGIPFGKIPQRFSVAEKPDAWEGTKSAKTMPLPCIQFFTFTQEIIGVEDCLHANVYTPSTKKGAKLPVIVWIFPGGFQIGGSFLFEGKYFMDEDVVLVTFNYRLGALGFLNTGDETVSGNMGLKDQVRALEWVKENIESFGGDPNLVTIMGLSAGSASVEYLTMSPMSKGLFHRAISQSGSILAPWAFQPNPAPLSKQLGEKLGCTQESSKDLVKCLREKTPSEIINAQLKFMKLGIALDFIHMKFIPSIESKDAKTPRFLTDTPYNLLKEGKISSKVPWMSGYVENEGSFYTAMILTQDELISKINSEWLEIAADLFYYEDSGSPKAQKEVSQKIKDFYLKDKLISKEKDMKRIFSNIYTDRFFTNSIAKSIILHAEHNQEVYPYYFDYQGQFSLIMNELVPERDGVGHADEMMYMFNRTVGSPEMVLGTRDGEFSEKFIKLLVSFAVDGKPTGIWGNAEWKPLKAKSPLKYYKVDLEKPDIIDDPLKERREFWDSLPLFGDGAEVKDEL